MIHNPQHYARDFYFFKRSQYPQLALVHKKPSIAYNELQKQCFGLKFVEMGKVMLTWGVLKNVNQVVQRVVFLHEDLMKLPSFPRKALEAELDLYANGQMGKVSTERSTARGKLEWFSCLRLTSYLLPPPFWDTFYEMGGTRLMTVFTARFPLLASFARTQCARRRSRKR